MDNFNYKNESTRKIIVLVGQEGLVSALIAAGLGLIYGFFSEGDLLDIINTSLFLMGIILTLYAFVFSFNKDKENIKKSFKGKTTFKESYLAKLETRQERIIHLYRAGVVFAVAILFDLAIYFIG
ncbi:hypothetical protein PRVXH_002517 [Proteinivorax hydrogeniformans]|uniref:DUF3899 domain-containing protein n=1 Tax=Proteinivorax hydrogeniformans TaxID=1826727 RepID=A0AAU8HTN3_9FIRM